MSDSPEFKAKKKYSEMLDTLNQYLFGGDLQKFKSNVKTIYDVKPKQLDTNRASDIIDHLEAKGVIFFRPQARGRKIDFNGLVQCMLSDSDKMKEALETVYKYWNEMNDILGLLRVECQVTSQKPPRMCTEASTPRDHKFHREDHRKLVDNTAAYVNLEPVFQYKVKEGIGLIRCYLNDLQKHSRGTGFRVGDTHIMTAYHVFENKINYIWTVLFNQLNFLSSKSGFSWKAIADALHVNCSDKALETFDSVKECILTPLQEEGVWYEGYRNIGIVIQKIDQMIGNADAKTLENLLEEEFQKKCDIRFNYTEERFVENNKNPNEVIEGKEFLFCLNIPFSSKEDDVLILQLMPPVYDSKRKYPEKFILDANSMYSHEFHVLGHPDGKVLQTDLHCKMLSKELEGKIQSEKVNFWTNFKKDLKEEDIEDAYKNCKTTESQVLFNVSQTTSHGASGAPCLHVRDGKPVVQVMLLGGYPKFFYNMLSKKEQDSEKLNPEFLVEGGIPMTKVLKLLQQHKLYTLCDELFKE